MDPKLLRDIEHRGEPAQADLAVVRSRDLLVRTRTSLVSHCRSMVKSLGDRLPSCSPAYFHTKAQEHVPEALLPALEPVFELLSQINAQIRAYDRQIEELAQTRYPEAACLQQVSRHAASWDPTDPTVISADLESSPPPEAA